MLIFRGIDDIDVFKKMSLGDSWVLESCRDLSPDSDEFAKEFGGEEKEHWITRVHFWVSKKLTI